MSCSGDMSEVKDPTIKLFGKIIRLPESDAPPNLHRILDAVFTEQQISDPSDLCSGVTAIEAKDIYVQDCGNQEKSSISGDEKWEQALENRDETQLDNNLQEDKRLISNIREEKVLKKPDKIIPCPRCTSLETKFCYFNNYNVKQPRHFCRNCQRYWTAGGTMRKVAVGAGRRKNKQLATQYCQIPVPCVAIQSATNPNIASQDLVRGDESPITLKASAPIEKLPQFGSEKVTYKSVLGLYPSDRSRHADIGSTVEIKEEQSQCVSSMTSIHEDEIHERVIGDEHGSLTASCRSLMPQQALPCFPFSPWMSAFNPCWNSISPSTIMSSIPAAQLSSEPAHQLDDVKSNQNNWLPSPVMAVCRLGPPTIPMQFTPTPYWGLSYWPTTAGNVPLAESSSGSQTRSKHSRDDDFTEAEASNKRVILPMTF